MEDIAGITPLPQIITAGVVMDLNRRAKQSGSITGFNTLNLSVKHYQSLSICGQSGYHKSTLLRILAGLLQSIDRHVLTGKVMLPDDVQKLGTKQPSV